MEVADELWDSTKVKVGICKWDSVVLTVNLGVLTGREFDGPKFEVETDGLLKDSSFLLKRRRIPVRLNRAGGSAAGDFLVIVSKSFRFVRLARSIALIQL